MHDHIRPEGTAALPIDWLVTPGLAFRHPNEVLDHPELSQAERRAILASWASDARALEGAHWMRCLDNGSVVTLAEVLGPAGYFTAMSGKWHVGQEQERDAERVAGPDEARALVGRVHEQHAALHLWLVGDNADDAAIQPAVADDHFLRPARMNLEQ